MFSTVLAASPHSQMEVNILKLNIADDIVQQQ